LNVVTIEEDRNLIIARRRKRVVNIIDASGEIVDLDEFRRNIALRTFDSDLECFATDCLECVGFRLRSDGELEVLNESVLEGGTFFDHDSVWRFGDGIVLEGDIDSMLAVNGGGICDCVSSIIVIDDLGRNITIGTNDLDFEWITTFAHLVTVPVSGFDIEFGRLGIIDVFETRSPDERIGSICSRFDVDIVWRILDVIEVERLLGVKDTIDPVVSGIDGLVVDGVGTIVVIDDLGVDFVTDWIEDLGIDRVSTLS